MMIRYWQLFTMLIFLDFIKIEMILKKLCDDQEICYLFVY